MDNVGTMDIQEQIVTPKVRSATKADVTTVSGAMLRSDAAWNETLSRAGLGWILTQNDVSTSFSRLENNVPSPLMAEGLALHETIQKSVELGVKNLQVESDSKILINSILNGNDVPELYGIVADILLCSVLFDSISFRWISREIFFVADLVAKHVGCK